MSRLSLLPLLLGSLSLTIPLPACDGTDPVAAYDTAGDGTLTPPELRVVTTAVSPTPLNAGGTLTVTCSARDQYDAPFPPSVPLDFEFFDANGAPPRGVTRQGDTLTAHFAGSFRVRCFFPGTPPIKDLSPVTVAVMAGPATALTTTLLKTSLQAGEHIDVACTLRDANENIAQGATELRVTPPDGTSVTPGKRITFTKVGTFTVACTSAAPALEGNPITVTVRPGPLAVLRTVLAPSTITAGGQVVVTCPGEDAFGNVVPLDRAITLPVTDLTGLDPDRLTLTGTRAGIYPITCAPKQASIVATQLPAELTITPAAPSRLSIDLHPNLTVFSPNAPVRVTARVFDPYDNEITDITGISIETRFNGQLQSTTDNGERVRLTTDGSWQVTARLGALSESRTLLVDGTQPAITLTSPVRGQMVTSDGSPIRLRGSIDDPTGGLSAVKINGAAQPITPGQTHFAIDMPLNTHHGLNTLAIEATDVQGFTTKIAPSFLAAPGWKPAAASFPDGVIAHLARAFLDDGNRTGALNDLATIAERTLLYMDIQGLIPSPIVQYSGYDVYLREVSYAPPRVTLAPSRDLLTANLTLDNLAIDVDAQGFIDLGGTVTASTVKIDAMLGLSVAQGRPKVTVSNIIIDIQNFRIDVNWSINWLINLFSDTIKAGIVDSLTGTLRSMLPSMLEGALASLALDETLAIPPLMPGLPSLNVRLQGRPDTITLNEQGLDLKLATQVSAARRVTWPTAGSIMRGGCFGVDGGIPAWDLTRKLTMALSIDALNQVLHAVWQGGALEATLPASALGAGELSDVGISDLTLKLSARLPPLLTDCQGQTLQLQIGELNLDATFTMLDEPHTVGIIVAFQTEAVVTVSPTGVINLALGTIDPNDMRIEVTYATGPFLENSADAFVDLLRSLFLGPLLEQLAGGSLAEFPLPEFDLGALNPVFAGQVIRVGNITLRRERGYLLLQGDP